jgi:hypothetical protein
MDIERILKMETTERDRLGMILSNRMDIVAMEKACISIDKWEDLASDLLKWHESLVTLGLPSVSKCTRCKELEFMITNGLGWEDLKDDNTYPID